MKKMTYSDYTNDYIRTHYKRLGLLVTKEEKETWTEFAAAHGLTLAGLIREAVPTYIERTLFQEELIADAKRDTSPYPASREATPEEEEMLAMEEEEEARKILEDM